MSPRGTGSRAESCRRRRGLRRRLRRSGNFNRDTQLRETYACDGFRLDTLSRRVVKPDGSACDLTPLEFQLLLFLMRNPGRFYSTEELYFNVWGRNSYGDARTVIVLVHGIRGKIEPNQKEPRYLVNRRGRGYGRRRGERRGACRRGARL